VFGIIARQEELVSSATLINAKFRQNMINRSLSHHVIVSYRRNLTACELKINIFKSNDHIPPPPCSHASIWANVPFPAFSLTSLPLFYIPFQHNLRFRSFLNGFLDYYETNDYCSPRGKYRILWNCDYPANPDRELARRQWEFLPHYRSPP